jgi:pimeloyl-ACP methyl ester carboxylesterase
MRRGLILGLLLVAGCGGSKTAPGPAPTPVPRLTGASRCPDAPKATCWTLTVALDRSGKVKDTLGLRVAVSGPAGAPVLVVLSGGPGEPGEPFHARAAGWLGPLAHKLRVVTFDQRGTGEHALSCPALQKEMGASDLTPPTQKAVTACAAALGDDRRFYTTADTVADLEALREALHADKLALDGISYGTYVAERYALAHPDRVRALVLDSVVPHSGVTVFSEVSMKATERVLRTACGKSCATDPVADLQAEVSSAHDGPQMLDLLTTLSISHPHLNAAIEALHRARAGEVTPLKRLAANVHDVLVSYRAPDLSQGLHASTLCADTPAPWGGADAPLADRRAKLDAAVAKLPAADLGPYDRATAAGNGIALQCLYWPPEPVKPPPAGGKLPNVPVLLIGGDNDLSTPLEWAQSEARTAPRGHLMVVPGAGHSVQSQGVPSVLAAVRRVLAV